jgi:hypothetical protein
LYIYDGIVLILEYILRYSEVCHSLPQAIYLYVLNTGHTFGTITDTMYITKTEKKGKYLNTLEKYHTTKAVKTSYT